MNRLLLSTILTSKVRIRKGGEVLMRQVIKDIN